MKEFAHGTVLARQRQLSARVITENSIRVTGCAELGILPPNG